MLDFLKANMSDHFFVGAMFLAFSVWMFYRVAQFVIETRKAAKEFISHVVDERVPKVIKEALSNGISEMMVRLNAEQDRRWNESMNRAFLDHEERETKQVNDALRQVETRIQKRIRRGRS